jgi:hypothetical protein
MADNPDFTINTSVTTTRELVLSGSNTSTLCIASDQATVLPQDIDGETVTIAVAPPDQGSYFLYLFTSEGKLYPRTSKDVDGQVIRTFDIPTSGDGKVYNFTMMVTDGGTPIVHDPKLTILPKTGKLPRC